MAVHEIREKKDGDDEVIDDKNGNDIFEGDM